MYMVISSTITAVMYRQFSNFHTNFNTFISTATNHQAQQNTPNLYIWQIKTNNATYLRKMYTNITTTKKAKLNIRSPRNLKSVRFFHKNVMSDKLIKFTPASSMTTSPLNHSLKYIENTKIMIVI